jgi:hypothetical protein
VAKYLVTYHGSDMPHEPEAMAQARDAFMQWAGKSGSALAEPGAPVRSISTISSSGAGTGAADGPITGWSVIEASSVEEATGILADHPFISRGGVLQISEPVEF